MGDSTSPFPPAQDYNNFTNMNDQEFVSCSNKYDPGGLKNIIESAKKGLGAIFPVLDENSAFSLNKADILDFNELDVDKFINQNAGPIGFIAFAAVLGIIMTIVGMFWCACRCCCRNLCGGKFYRNKNHIEKDGHKFKRYICGALFIFMAVVSFSLLVTSLAVNGQMKKGIDELPSLVDNALEDAETYLNTTQKQIQDVLIVNYEVLGNRISGIIDDLDLPPITFPPTSPRTLPMEVDELERDLDSILKLKTNLATLKDEADVLESGVHTFKQEFLKTLELCQNLKAKDPACYSLERSLATDVETLSVENDFQENLLKVPQAEWMAELSNVLLDTKVYLATMAAPADLIQDWKDEISNQIRSTGSFLRDTSAELTSAIDEILEEIKKAREDLDAAETDIQDISPYVSTSMILICVALILIVTVMTLGVVMIMLDSKGDNSSRFYSDKTGAALINCGIFTVFLTYLLFIVIMLVYFLIAGVGGKILCQAVENLEASESPCEESGSGGRGLGHVHVLDGHFNSKLGLISIDNGARQDSPNTDDYVPPSFSCIINSCKNSSSAYRTFKLESAFDIRNLTDLASRFPSPNVPIRQALVDQLLLLADNSNTRFSTGYITRQLTNPVTSRDLKELNKKLQQASQQISNPALKTSMKGLGQILEKLQAQNVEPMRTKMETTVQVLEPKSRTSSSDLAPRIRSIAEGLRESRAGPIDSYNSIVKEVTDFGNIVIEQIDGEVGQCEPMYNAYTYTKEGFCINVVSPVGGFWLGLSVVLALTIPMLISACVLTGIVTRDGKTKGYQNVIFCM